MGGNDNERCTIRLTKKGIFVNRKMYALEMRPCTYDMIIHLVEREYEHKFGEGGERIEKI
jgi:hypothetical protein